MVGQEESTVARREAPEDRRKIQRIAPTGYCITRNRTI